MKRRAFTLLELMIVVIIIGILASLALPAFKGAIINARMGEMYSTVAAIEKAEEIYYAEYGAYCAAEDGIPGIELYYSTSTTIIQRFRDALGLEIPGMNSVFVYGVYYDPTNIYVRVRENFDWHILCYKRIGSDTWQIRSSNPWSKYVRFPKQVYE